MVKRTKVPPKPCSGRSSTVFAPTALSSSQISGKGSRPWRDLTFAPKFPLCYLRGVLFGTALPCFSEFETDRFKIFREGLQRLL